MREEVESYLEQLRSGAASGVPDLLELRTSYRDAVAAAAELFPPPPVAERSWIKCPTPAGPIRALLQRPGEDRQAPLILYFHGGGYAVADPEATEFATARLALRSGATVLSVDYRLAPEHPYPAALEDGIAALEWVREAAGELGVNADRIALAGDSSGAAVAAAVALRGAAAGRPVNALLLFYGWFDMTLSGRSMAELGPTDPVIPTALLESFRAAAFGEDLRGWAQSDLLQTDLSGLPETFVAVGGRDPLLSDSERLVERLRETAVPVEYHCFDVQPHGFFTMPFLTDAARLAELAASFVASRLGSAP